MARRKAQKATPADSAALSPKRAAALAAARKLALAIAESALDRKAINVEIIDVVGKVDYADYVLVMSGRSDRQVSALAKNLEGDVSAKVGARCLSVEGLPQASWVLMDFGDVIVHIFHEDTRGYYDLESLWIDAPRIPVAESDLRIAIVAVGKIKERALREVVDDYLGRIRRYSKLDEIEIKDGKDVREKIERALDPRGRVVALEIDGEAWSSKRLAQMIGECADASVPSVSFVIGGAYGLPPEISRAAHVRLSLGAMTLPHRLARLVLAEQIYRAFTILRGEPYSHD